MSVELCALSRSLSLSILAVRSIHPHMYSIEIMFVCPHVPGRVFTVAEIWWSVCSRHHNLLVQ